VCPIADALDIVGERWSLLILREIGFGVQRFSDIRCNTGAPRERLVARLRELEEAGVIARRRYSDRPPRDEYVFTESGRAIAPVLRELHKWGEHYGRQSTADGRGHPESSAESAPESSATATPKSRSTRP
jgi:DNA-binding HxlR family transcriptional regulator